MQINDNPNHSFFHINIFLQLVVMELFDIFFPIGYSGVVCLPRLHFVCLFVCSIVIKKRVMVAKNFLGFFCTKMRKWIKKRFLTFLLIQYFFFTNGHPMVKWQYSIQNHWQSINCPQLAKSIKLWGWNVFVWNFKNEISQNYKITRMKYVLHETLGTKLVNTLNIRDKKCIFPIFIIVHSLYYCRIDITNLDPLDFSHNIQLFEFFFFG